MCERNRAMPSESINEPAGLVSNIESLATSVQRDLDFRVINGAGHWVTYEAADEVNAALLDMLLSERTNRLSHQEK